ncbi:MAG: hypothetical protein E7605_03355 [Ruminococcaceae bacterium]|nr:hypothetical protein [Oscillospiraceae bacterium]
MPFGNSQREKSFRCRSTHFFAKVSIFSFCVGVFNKNANMKDARKHKRKKFLPTATHPGLTNFSAKTILFSAPATKTGCRGASPYQESKTFLLSLPAARGGKTASDAE